MNKYQEPQKVLISTHTLTWSVTAEVSENSYIHMDFNSHAHVERDSKIDVTTASGNISTHTLTWSVTPLGAKLTDSEKFQLTRSRGA